jgi:hypothetical protein
MTNRLPRHYVPRNDSFAKNHIDSCLRRNDSRIKEQAKRPKSEATQKRSDPKAKRPKSEATQKRSDPKAKRPKSKA